MNYPVLTTLGLSLCITSVAMAQKTATVIVPPPSNFNAIPTARSQDDKPAPFWVVAQDNRPTNDRLSPTEETLIKAGEYATDSAVDPSVELAKAYTQKIAEKLEKTSNRDNRRLASHLKGIATKNRTPGYVTPKTALDKSKALATKAADSTKKTNQAKTKTNFLSKLGTVLNLIEVVSVAAETAGYLSAGDTIGATSAAVKGGVKKGAETAGALAGSVFTPAGSIAGAMAGNAAYKEFVEPKIEAAEEAARDEQTRKKYVNKPWYTPQQYMDSDGNIQYLSEDQYMDKETGDIYTRSPEEQKEYEHQQRVHWQNQNTLQKLIEDYKNGKLSGKDLLDLIERYDRHDDDSVWDPEADTETDEEANEETKTETDEDQPDFQALLADVPPVKLTAKGSKTRKIGDLTVLETYTFTFWNVGNYVPQYKAASLRVDFTSKTHNDYNVMTGTFSGGPNGTITIQHDEGSESFNLRNGTHVTGELGNLPISNPAAFANWPKELK